MRFVAALIAALMMSAPAWAQPASGWPGGRQAAIALTYDDSAKSQLDIAIPQLDAAGLKGTFFLMGRAIGDEAPRWRAVAANGHELANHTINHPCLQGTFEMPTQYNSESYSVGTLLTEIQVMNVMLQALDGKTRHAFGTPCGHTTAGGQDYLGPLQQSGLATYVRDAAAVLPGSGGPALTGTGFADVTGQQMIEWVEGVRRSGGAGVIVFHGVGGDHLAVSAEAHRELVTWLKAHDRQIWTATYTEVMDAVMAQRTR